MSHQPNLFPPSSANGSAVPDQKSVHPNSRRAPLWIRRVEIFLYVILRVYVGVIVFVLPWTSPWTHNHLIHSFPRLSTFLMYGAVRGIISGLGLLNLWIAVYEAMHYRESTF